MSKSTPKIALSASRDIPFSRLVLSQANVRRVKAGIAIEELAEDIARRTLLQSLTVRPVLDADGVETGMFDVPSGGRRYRALELLVKQKRLARTAPIPCVVRTEGLAEEDSLAENVQRAPLHPLDQFRAFQALREKGRGEEEIAAAFFVSGAVVKQRLRLAAVSPRLLDVYAEDGMTLEQLMAFTVSADHARQEAVWEALQRSPIREPYQIRRLLTEGAVRASDRRARFVGAAAYEAAGGVILRDLFAADDGGWWQDPVLLDRLAHERLAREAEAIRAEGWRWVEAAPDFPYGHTYGLRRLAGTVEKLSEEAAARRAALGAEYDELERECAEADEVPEETDARLAEIEEAIAALDERPVAYDPAETARAGAFVSIDGAGALRVERGYVRPEDEATVATAGDNGEGEAERPATGQGAEGSGTTPAEPDSEPTAERAEEDEGIRPLPDRLLTELTAHRTLALRDAVAGDPQVATLAATHALCLRLFYRYASDTCLEIEPKSALFSAQAPGLADTASARASEARHARWQAQLPAEPGELWAVLAGFDADSREALFAHLVGLTVNAVHEAYNRRPKAIAHADRIAEAVGLDMVEAGWRPTVANYLGRVTKARILDAVREGKGEAAAELIAHLKKADMAAEAERLLADTGWTPEPLRLAGARDEGTATALEALPAFLAEEGESAGDIAAETLPIAAE
jgi:ParB family chromosome partitioning protein